VQGSSEPTQFGSNLLRHPPTIVLLREKDMKIINKFLLPLVLIVASILTVTYAAVTLSTQTIPPIPASAGTAANCTALSSFDPPSGLPLTSVPTGSAGIALLDCSGDNPGTATAFHLRVPAGSLFITPQFTLPAPYHILGILTIDSVPYAANAVCIPGPNPTILTSGNMVLLGTGECVYCAEFSDAPTTGLPSFSITWTTPTTPFTQTISAVPALTSMKNNCGTLTAYDPTLGFAPLTGIATGSTGFIYYDCSGANAAGRTSAFTIDVFGAPVSFTPHFTLSAPYVGVALNPVSPLACDAGSFRFQIMSGSAFTFSSSDNFGYCVLFQNAPSTGLPALDITWTT
jgi:hypothetical protein